MNLNNTLYFDHNATTPIAPEVAEAMAPFLYEGWGNPSSAHSFGQKAKRALDEAREEVAALLGASPSEVVFTSGGTESSNHAIFGTLAHRASASWALTSNVEHPATRAPLEALLERGLLIETLSVNDTGALSPNIVKSKLKELSKLDNRSFGLMSLMLANNETGVIFDVAAFAALIHDQGGLIHTDAAQALGKIAVDVKSLGVDLLTLAGHKLYAPKGVGALYVKAGTELRSFMHGAGHEKGRRAGTESVLLAVGLGRAARLARETLKDESARQTLLRDALLAGLKSALGAEQIRQNGAGSILPNTLNVSFKGVDGDQLLARCEGLAASLGSACHEGGTFEISPVLRAMNVPEIYARGAVRLSIGRSTKAVDIEQAVNVLSVAYRSISESSLPSSSGGSLRPQTQT